MDVSDQPQNAREAQLEAALRESIQALDDWTVTYASDMCDEAHVEQARRRISDGGGTLAHIAFIQQRNRAALEK